MSQEASKTQRNNSPRLSTGEGSRPYQWSRLRVLLPPGLARRQRSLAGLTEVWGVLGKTYDPKAAQEKAQQKRDPLLSPHGFLRALGPGDNGHAVEFLETFGPLVISEELRFPLGGLDRALKRWLARLPPHVRKKPRVAVKTVRIDLRDFWAKQTEFRLVAQLYERRKDREGLRRAWREIGTSTPHSSIGSILEHQR